MIRLVASHWPVLDAKLHPGDCIHVTLTLHVDDIMQITEDACVRDWVANVAHMQDVLADAAPPDALIHLGASHAFVRLALDRPHLSCDSRALRTALDEFLIETEAAVRAAHLDGSRWWADARERVAHMHSELSR